MKIKLTILLVFFGAFLFASDSSAAQFYIDSECNTPGDGTTTTCNGDADDSYDNLDDFTEVARTAGDIATVRRVASSSFNGTDVNFTSDGTITSLITLEADYNNYWGDFASSSQTYTVVRGSKAMTASAAITGIAAGDWIFVDVADQTTEKARDFAYEVQTVSGTVLTLYFPYGGNNPGTVRTLNVMPDAPVWNTATGDFQLNIDSDLFWLFRGLDIRGTDANGQVEIDSVGGNIRFYDSIFTGNGAGDTAFEATDDYFMLSVSKSRSSNNGAGFFFTNTDSYGVASFRDILIGPSGTMPFLNLASALTALSKIYAESITTQGTSGNVNFLGAIDTLTARNIITASGGTLFNMVDNSRESTVSVEDFQVLSSNSYYSGLSSSPDDSPLFVKTTGTVRTGGGGSSIKVTPNTNFGNTWDVSELKLFEYPIYLNTSQTTFNVYFRPDVIASWSADPTADELWVEIDVLASASGAFRYTKKSTGVIDMNGSIAWQAIPLVVTASQSGNAYLKGWYAKPQEAVGTTTTDANVFFVDVRPEITQP